MKRCICKQQLVSSKCLVTKGSWQWGHYSSRLEHNWNRFEHKHVAYSGLESSLSLSQSQSVKPIKQSLGIKIHLQLYLNSLKSLKTESVFHSQHVFLYQIRPYIDTRPFQFPSFPMQPCSSPTCFPLALRLTVQAPQNSSQPLPPLSHLPLQSSGENQAVWMLQAFQQRREGSLRLTHPIFPSTCKTNLLNI